MNYFVAGKIMRDWVIKSTLMINFRELMQRKNHHFSNFSRAIHTTSTRIRPDNEWQLESMLIENNLTEGVLARGKGLSYSDCCVNDKGTIIDTTRLNHLLSFDATTGIAECQGGVSFADLFTLCPDFIPPVIPGTLYATLAGGVANDIHGKNNPLLGNFGHHIEWLELQLKHESIRCSHTEHQALFKATIAGLGLTGVIKRVAVRLRKTSRIVCKQVEKFTCLSSLLQRMERAGLQYEYQVAWLDLLNTPRALLSLANHVKPTARDETSPTTKRPYTVPKLPLRLVTHFLMKQFNRLYYHQANTDAQTLPLWQFNNPLDAINDWSKLYGKKGLLQFQAVFSVTCANKTLDALLAVIRSHHATPTLAVLKYFTEAGTGLLSFPEPGFTLSIDFIHNEEARGAIAEMNQLISTIPGKIYLAKDLLLTHKQFRAMYPKYEEFQDILTQYNSPMSSLLSKRLRLHR